VTARGRNDESNAKAASLSTETVRYVDTVVELEVGGRRCQYAPMRMEWSFDPDSYPLEERELVFTLQDEEMSVLQIHMTEACNLRCTYCSHFRNPAKGKGSLSDEEVEMLIERIRGLPPDGTVILHGGEPFLQSETVLRFVEVSPVQVVIFTNGTLLTPEILARLKGRNVLLLLSADGDPQTTGQVRVGPRGADRTADIFVGLELVAESGVPFGIPMVMGDHNIDNITEQVGWLNERYAPGSFGVGHQHYMSRGEMPDHSPARLARVYVELLRFAGEHGVYIDQLARRITPIVRGKPLLKDCSACGTKQVYHPGGRWMNCTNNTEEDTSQHAWSRYLPIFTDSCHGCIGIGVCGGGCIADAKKLNPGGFDERYCESTRAVVRTVLEACAGDPELSRTNRARLGEVYAHMVQTRGESGARASVGHDAAESRVEAHEGPGGLLGQLLANREPAAPLSITQVPGAG
jgi:uncharacterized protein